MKVTVITKTKETEAEKFAREYMTNTRHENAEYITGQEIENSYQFNKARGIRAAIMNLMNLKPVDTENENEIDQETFDQYVHMGNVIDRCFTNLIEELVENYECDEDDDICDGCECRCCESEHDCDECEKNNDLCVNNSGEDDECDDCEFSMDRVVIEDCLTLVHMFKNAFCFDSVNDTDDISLDLTGEEYNRIKEILDRYEIEEVEENEEGSNT